MKKRMLAAAIALTLLRMAPAQAAGMSAETITEIAHR